MKILTLTQKLGLGMCLFHRLTSFCCASLYLAKGVFVATPRPASLSAPFPQKHLFTLSLRPILVIFTVLQTCLLFCLLQQSRIGECELLEAQMMVSIFEQ